MPTARSHSTPPTTTTPSQARTNQNLNLSVLRRHHPPTHTIDHTHPYAVIYTFNPLHSTWSKTGIEGTLFIVQTHTPDIGRGYAIVVLNRRGLENFILELRGVECQVTDEYVILKKGDGEEGIFGVWVFEEGGGEGRGVGEMILERAGEVGDEEGLDGTGEDGEKGEVDLLDLFRKAGMA